MAKVFLDANETYTISSNSEVFGGTGAEKILINGTPTVTVQSTVERVDLGGALNTYTFGIAGNVVTVKSGTTTVATITVPDTTAGQTLAFTNGSAPLKITGLNTATLGGVAVPTTAAAVAATLNAADPSTATPIVPVVVTPTFAITGSSTASEGTSATYTVTLSSAPTADVVVPYATTYGTTTATSADHTGGAGSLTFTAANWATAQTITVPIVLDGASPETDEAITVTLGTPTGATAALGTTKAVTTAITDVPVTYTLTAATTAATVYEGSSITYTVTASANVAANTDVAFSIVPGDPAAADQGTNLSNLNDFAAGSFNPSTVTIPAGTKTATFVVSPAIDTKTELTETFSVKAVVGTTTLPLVAGTVLDGTGVTSGVTYTLTTGVDTWGSAASSATQNFNGTVVDSFNAFDSLTGGSATNDTLSANITATVMPAGGTITGIETAIINSTGAGFTGDTTAWTGLTSLTINDSTAGNVNLTAPTTTSVTATAFNGTMTIAGGNNVTTTQTTGGNLTISGEVGAVVATDKLVAGAVLINGGTSVNLTATGITTGGTITIGNVTKPSGAVTVVATTNETANNTASAITVNGGTTVSITENLVATPADGTVTVTSGAIGVNGGAATTSVTVSQTAAATAATAVTGVTGVSAVSVVAAAPGTQGVTAITGVNFTKAVTAATGVVNGAVTIADLNASAGTNTIAAVTLANSGAGSLITSNALTSLNLTGTGTLTLTRTVANSSPTLALTANGTLGAMTDTNNEITTLNVTCTGANSTLASFADTGLLTLNVSGDKVFKMTTITPTITTVAVSGTAGFNDGGTTAANGFAAIGAAGTFTTTSSGPINLSLNSTAQTFTGTTGVDTIIISSTANATKVITAGSATTDELKLEGGAYALTAATGAKVTGFEVLGVAANATGTIDVSALGTFNKLHVIGNNSNTFTKVATGAALNIDIASTTVSYNVADATGTTDSVTLTLGSSTSDSVNFGTVKLADANAVGIGTVNLVNNGVNITTGDAIANTHTMVLTDNGMSNLNFSGTTGMTFTTMDQATTQATSITINNTNTSSFGLLATSLQDDNLGQLNFAGTGKTVITALTDATSTLLNITNTGTITPVITEIAGAGGAGNASTTIRSMTLTGNVQIGTGLVTSATGITLSNTNGITISGATDNAPVRAIITGAAAGNTDSITLGNANNSITDTSSATTATVNITVGTGYNKIAIGNGVQALDSVFNITLGAHTSTSTLFDHIVVNNTAGANFATVVNNVITGAVTGDRIEFGSDLAIVNGGAGTATLTATATVASASSVATAIAALATATGAHAITYGVYNGDTYVSTSISGTEAANDVALIKIVGTHTLSFTNDAGGVADYITLLS